MFWGQIGVKRCQNWSQKWMKKVSEIWGVTWVYHELGGVGSFGAN